MSSRGAVVPKYKIIPMADLVPSPATVITMFEREKAKRALATASTPEIRKYLVTPDMHVKAKNGILDGVDYESLVAVLAYAQDNGPWTGWINLGDFLDLNVISSHNRNNLRAIAGESLAADFAAGNHVLDAFQHTTCFKESYYLEGNHEYRVSRLIDAQPQLQGLVEVPRNLNLKDRGVKWVPYWSEDKTIRIGKAEFAHGRYTNITHARTHVDRYDCNIFYGHLHSVEQTAKVVRGPDSTKIAQCMGCLCRYDQPYLNGAATKWSQAFGVFHFFPDGNFTYFVPMLFKNRFVSPEGKVYDGRELVRSGRATELLKRAIPGVK